MVGRVFGFGLRGRFVLALLFVSAATLLLTAVLVLSPLENRLHDDALRSLARDARVAAASLAGTDSAALTRGSPALKRFASSARRHSGAQIVVADARGQILVTTDPDASGPVAVTPVGGPVRQITGSGRETAAQVVIPVSIGGTTYALEMLKPISEVQAVTGIVRTGFIEAASVSLIVALALGILIATRLVRRLRALREATMTVVGDAPDADLAIDDARDEVGDLTRSFATMQTHLRQQESARRAFVATASHELRTPLASLRLQLGLLREDLEAGNLDLDDAREQVIGAERQAARLSTLAVDLLNLSRMDAGVKLRREPTGLIAICRDVLAEAEATTDPGGAKIRLVDDGTGGRAWCDPGATAQIVRILLDNARHHARGATEIVVAARGGEAILVEDDGPGVAASERGVIFERFRRGAASHEAPGFGLGLAIARELARRMDGDLVLEHPIGPTRFTLHLEPVSSEGTPVSVERDSRDSPTHPNLRTTSR